MTQRLLLIRLFENGGAEWGLFAPDGERLRGPESGLPGPDAAGDARVVALAPGEGVLLTEAAVPTRNPARLRRALPFAVEDRLAADLESVHVAPGPRAPDGRVPAAVVDRELLERWIADLDRAGLQPDAFVPEPLALPREPGEAALLIEDGRAVVRRGEWRGWAGEASLLEALPPPSEGALRVYASGGFAGRLPGGWPDATRVEELEGPVLALYARGLGGGAMDLLQGEYTPRRAHRGLARLWRVAAAVLALWALLELAFSAVDAWQLQRQSERLESRIEAVFAETFPGARMVDPRAQMARRLEAMAAADGDALSLLRRVAPVLARNGAVTLQSLEYRDGELTLSLRAGSLAALDRLRAEIASSPGLRAEMGSATAGERGVDGRIVVRGGVA